MPEIIICDTPLSTSAAQSCGVNCHTPIGAYQPIITGNSANLRSPILSQLNDQKAAKILHDTALTFGEDNTVAIAQIMDEIQPFLVGHVGASTGLYIDRMKQLKTAIQKYQDALLYYHSTIKSKASGANQMQAKFAAKHAFDNMQKSLHLEVKKIVGVKHVKRSPLTNFDRGINIAKSSRNVTKLNLTTPMQEAAIVRYSKYAKFLGNGLVMIDVASRVGNIHNAYQTGGDPYRELFIESSSFAASTTAGLIATNIGLAGLKLLLMLTPAGWIGLIVGGLVVAAGAAYGAIKINTLTKQNAGMWYDNIMRYNP